MRFTLALCALAIASAAATNQKQADKQFATNQLALGRLFIKLEEPNKDKEQQEIGNKFQFSADKFTNPKAAEEFQNAYQLGGFLPRGEVFSYTNPNQLQQAIQLFDVFFFAKDFDTFYQAACWARDRINEGQFNYALSVAILNRPDSQGYAVLPQSEVNPFLYVNSRIIQEVQGLKQQGHKQINFVYNSSQFFNYVYGPPAQGYPFKASQNNDDPEKYANQYKNFAQFNYEYLLGYYYEDVKLNQQFAYEALKNPSWLNAQKYKTENKPQKNGENFYYYLQQALARFNLERLCNFYQPIEPFQFSEYIKYGYNPRLQYANGQNVPSRPDNTKLSNANINALQQAENIDKRIADAVASNQALKADGTYVKLDAEKGVEILGNIILNNGDSVNNEYYSDNSGYYGYFDLLRRVVGSVVNPYNQDSNAPSAIENFNSAARDPVFYQIISRIVNYFQNFKNKLKPYNQEQLNFEGVKVQSVSTDKLITYYENNEVDLVNAIHYTQEEQPQHFDYKAQIPRRLNTKPFSYTIQVDSDKETNAIVRVFVGPPKWSAKGQLFSLEQSRGNFVEIDRFTTKLKSGQNSIQRSSEQSTRFADQQIPTHQLFQQNIAFLRGGPTYTYNANPAGTPATFPKNLILPRGGTTGLPLVLAVSVNSYAGAEGEQDDGRPQGFPFDRVVRESSFQQAKNIKFQVVKIFNKKLSEETAQQ